MSISPARSPIRAHLDEEEQLPLYTQHEQPGDEKDNHQHVIPQAEATPEQVREFLVSLLAIERGLAIDHSKRIAARWTIGKGQELRSYPPAMYLEVFGREDGWIVYREVKLYIYKEMHEKTRKETTGIHAEVFMTLVAFAIEAALLYGFISSLTGADNHLFRSLFCGFLFVPNLFLCIGAAVSTYEKYSTPNHEKKVEKELQECMKKSVPGQS